MLLPVNSFKHAILSGKRQIGLWSSLGSSTASEIIAGAGFDWVLVDTEHAPNELPDVLAQLRAMSESTTTAVVRPAWNDMVLVKRFLDIGAQALLIPFVQDAAEAAYAVSSMRYPPRGTRGVGLSHHANRYGRIENYFDTVEDELCLLVQLETREALAELEAIATTDGVHGVFIGPSDLSASLGHLGDPNHPDVQGAIADALDRCERTNTPAGILTGVVDDANRYLDMGFTFVAVGVDTGILRRASEDLRKLF